MEARVLLHVGERRFPVMRPIYSPFAFPPRPEDERHCLVGRERFIVQVGSEGVLPELTEVGVCKELRGRDRDAVIGELHVV